MIALRFRSNSTTRRSWGQVVGGDAGMYGKRFVSVCALQSGGDSPAVCFVLELVRGA
jgi:hypothetical protein